MDDAGNGALVRLIAGWRLAMAYPLLAQCTSNRSRICPLLE